MIFFILNIFMWFSLFHASTSDPGYLPRNVPEYDLAIKQVSIEHRDFSSLPQGRLKGPFPNEKYSKIMQNSQNFHFYPFILIPKMVPRGCSGSQKVGARKIAMCHFQVPVLKVRSQFRSQLKFLQGANFFEPKLDDCMYLACSVSCINGPDLFVQMLMSVLYFCFFSFRFHHQKQKDLYNLLQ